MALPVAAMSIPALLALARAARAWEKPTRVALVAPLLVAAGLRRGLAAAILAALGLPRALGALV